MDGFTKIHKAKGLLNFPAYQRGFNLVELIVIVAIIGIIAAISNPSYQAFIRNQAINAVSTEIVSTFQTARTEAIKRSVPVKVCFKKEATDTDCKDPGEHSGASLDIYFIYLFIDDDNDNEHDTNEELIFNSNRFSQNVILKQNADYNLGGSVQFDQKGGATFQSDGSHTTAYIAICDEKDDTQFGTLIAISATGRASFSNINDDAVIDCA